VAELRVRRILVVDDDDAIRAELASALGADPALDLSMADDGRDVEKSIRAALED